MTKQDLVRALEPFGDEVEIVLQHHQGHLYGPKLFYLTPVATSPACLVLSADIPTHISNRTAVQLRTS